MKTSTARLLTLLPWLAPPALAAAYLLLWDRMPERLAVLVFVIGTSTFRLRRKGPAERASGLLILNASVLFVMLVFCGLLKYNITGSLF